MSLFRSAASFDCRPQARLTQTCASLHRADGAGLDQLHDAAVVVAGVDLVPIWVATLALAAASRMIRASPMLWVSGFSQ